MGAVGQRGDHGGVDAFLAHGGSQVVHDELAVTGVGESLDVIVYVLQIGALMGDNDNTGISGFLQNRVQRLNINGNHADGVHILGDQVLHQLGLQRGVDLIGTLLVAVDAGFLSVLLHAHIHADEPGVGRIFGNHNDLPILAAGGLSGAGGVAGIGCVLRVVLGGLAGRTRCHGEDHGCSKQQSNQLFHILFPPVSFLNLYPLHGSKYHGYVRWNWTSRS